MLCATGLILLFEPEQVGDMGRSKFFLNVMRLHRWLFDLPPQKGAMTTGKMIVGITAICMVIVIVTGLVMWYLRARRAPVKNLQISFSKGFRMFCTSLHVSGGFYVSIFLLIMALTGLTWSWGWYREGFNALFGIAKGSHVVYLIHTGAIGDIFTRILWFLTALIGFCLPLTGYYMWISRLLARRRQAKI